MPNRGQAWKGGGGVMPISGTSNGTLAARVSVLDVKYCGKVMFTWPWSYKFSLEGYFGRRPYEVGLREGES